MAIYTGAFTALVTPMRGGEVDLQGLRELVEFQIEAGIDGLVPCGTTGEAATLTAAEQVDVIGAVVQQAAGRVPVIAGASANCTRRAVEASKAAAEAGADGLLHVTPFYNKPSQDGLVAHFRAVAEATQLPVVMYNVPGRTCCDMLPETAARLAATDGIVGIKEATGSVARGQQVIDQCPRDFSVLSGDDFTCMALAAVGGSGVISVISNLLPGEVSAMIRAAREGDLVKARQLHYRMEPLMHALFMEPNPVPVKAGLHLMRASFSDNDVRLPLLPLAGQGLESLRAELSRLGLVS